MSAEIPDDGLKARFSRQGEETLGRLAQELLESPLVSGAISRVFDAREKAAQAQEVAMGALNLPSAADLERLTRRVRSLAQRLEGIEDGVDRLDQHLASLEGDAALDKRLDAIQERLDEIAGALKAPQA
jgi:chromosome segregation ATPase